MACLGVHFALTPSQEKKLLDAEKKEDGDLVMEIVEEIEEDWDEEFNFESDKSWDAMHRCLSNGTLNADEGEYPLNIAIFGGRYLPSEENYFVMYIDSKQVKDVSAALSKIDLKWLTERYWKMSDDYQDEKSEEDLEYTWENLQKMQKYFEKVATTNRSVIFTVDQ